MWKSTLIAMCYLFSAATHAQDMPREVRKIAPERFQPTPRGDFGSTAQSLIVEPPTKEHPLGSCDRVSRSWTFCLRSTVDLTDALVGQAEDQVIKTIRNRPDLNTVTKQGFENDLKEAGVKWRALREIECGNLALQEIEIAKSAYEARMICQIERNSERVDRILDRYKARLPQTTETIKSP